MLKSREGSILRTLVLFLEAGIFYQTKSSSSRSILMWRQTMRWGVAAT